MDCLVYLLFKYFSNANFRQDLNKKRAEIDLLIKKKQNEFMQTTFELRKINKYKNFINFLKLYKTRQFVLYKFSGIIKSNKKTYYPDDNKTLNLYFQLLSKRKSKITY